MWHLISKPKTKAGQKEQAGDPLEKRGGRRAKKGKREEENLQGNPPNALVISCLETRFLFLFFCFNCFVCFSNPNVGNPPESLWNHTKHCEINLCTTAQNIAINSKPFPNNLKHFVCLPFVSFRFVRLVLFRFVVFRFVSFLVSLFRGFVCSSRFVVDVVFSFSRCLSLLFSCVSCFMCASVY